MDDDKFGRLARAFNKTGNRRWLVGLAGAATAMLGQRVASGVQLGAATCGAQGAVCTLLSGCCDGLTCATSAINTSYGICVPGEGGMIATGTTLIFPFSETAVEEVTALMQTDGTAPTTDPQADRDAHMADIRARREAKRTDQRTRTDTRRSTRHNRKRDHNPGSNPGPQLLRPQLEVELLFKQVDVNSKMPGDQLGPIEVVRATNRDVVDVVLTRIETIKEPIDGSDLTTSQFTLGLGESYSFVSGLLAEDAADSENGRYRWLSKIICDTGVTRQGYRLNAAFSGDADNYDYIVLCTSGRAVAGVGTTSGTSRRKQMPSKRQDNKKNR